LKTANTLVASIATFVLILFLFFTSVSAQTAAADTLKNEMGLLKLQIIYPENNATVTETQPMISADASNLETPLDSQTVTVYLNGTDVTESAEITSAYVTYQPLEPLPLGKYEVRITASDVNKKVIEPLSWQFTISGGTAQAAATGGEQEKKKSNASGRLVTSTDWVKADYKRQDTFDVSQIFQEKEGAKQNVDLNFTNTSEGRTIVGSYHRETQDYTDVELDKVRMNYYDKNFSSTLGHHWFSLSDLTVIGTELAGFSLNKDFSKWSLTTFSGRTQDPSTSGTFKQIATGARGSYNWNEKSKTSLTVLTAAEDHDLAYELSGAKPAKDEIVSVMQEQKFLKHFNASLELANNNRKIGGNSYYDAASRLFVTGNLKKFSVEAEAYRIGSDFFPIAEGSSKYLKNDRIGYRGKGSYQLVGIATVGGEYEQYDTDSTDIRTKRGNAFVTVSTGVLQSLTYRKGKLTSNGTVSETDSVMTVLVLPAAGNLTETRLSAGWLDINYSAAGILTETTVKMMGINTAYKDRLGLAANYSISNNDNVLALTSTENTNLSLGLNWNIIPFKLMWMNRYEALENSGFGVDNSEKRIKTNFKYVFDKVYSFNVGYDNIKYTDTITTIYDYKQNIYRTGVEWNF
jgi:hypothetical protein